ncbi:MAG: hypothetical protein KDA31_08250 [Phycisphaerales bacterium]|nr:hypothetical protein [Phycisphaerales bacterium]MCB9835901.1 hypothetical protein [Phycisphaera sp.]
MMTEPLSPNNYCAGCGYCLGGLLESASCPECNKPCAESIAEAEVAGSKHVRRLRLGAVLAIIGTAGILSHAVGSVVYFELIDSFSYALYSLLEWGLHLSVAVSVSGWFILTRLNRNITHDRPPNGLRRFARWSSVAMLAAHLAFYFVIQSWWAYAAVDELIRWCVFMLPLAVYLLATAVYARTLFAQIPGTDRRSHFRLYFWIIAVGISLVGASWAIQLWKMNAGVPPDPSVTQIVLRWTSYTAYLMAYAAHLLITVTLLRTLRCAGGIARQWHAATIDHG